MSTRRNPMELLDDEDRRAALGVSCPHCKATSPNPCQVPNLRKPRQLSGGRVHDARMQKALADRPASARVGGWF